VALNARTVPVHLPRMSMKVKVGAALLDGPRFAAAMLGPRRWVTMRNRHEAVRFDGRGARCEWEYTSELHIGNVFPRASALLMKRAFTEWPVRLRDAPATLAERPDVSFVIGHRGLARLPHLLTTLRSIAAQEDASVEVVVVEQSTAPEINASLPSWVRYVHTPVPEGYDYNRSWTLNAGAREARGTVLILHDNDMLCPARYAAETLERAREGWQFQQLKRFTFYLPEPATTGVFQGGHVPPGVPATVVQNLHGASIAADRSAYFEAGGFDEEFVGWGGEDNEFWQRAEAIGRVYSYGYLPFLHLWHAPQKGKLDGGEAPAVRRWHQLRDVSPVERIRRLKERE
jgi:GT2 family glycosyltransferase